MPKRKLPTSLPPEKGCAIAETSTATEPEASTDSQKDEPPPYGTQEYWEIRYAESSISGHSWYFTYDELRPLLLPLLLGRDTETFVDGDDDEGEWEEEEEEAAGAEEIEAEKEIEDQAEGGNKATSEDDGQAENESKSSDDDDDNASHALEEHPPKSVLEVGCGDVPLGHALLLDLLSMQRDTGADANLVVKEIVCNDYAKSVVDALRKQQSEHWMSGNVKGSYETAEGRDGRKVERLALDKATEGGIEPTDRPTLDVTYVMEDARDMAYKDESFDLIIDKGTTDALLSDKEEGISNCVKVVAEMGRCVTRGGFIMVVSHMNAHCDAGIDWCDKVLVAGLRASRPDASWEIEVHGSDTCSSDAAHEGSETDDEKDADDETDEGITPPPGSPGPAVYIIHKLPPKPPKVRNEEDQEKEETEKEETEKVEGSGKKAGEEAVIETIPLNFFTY